MNLNASLGATMDAVSLRGQDASNGAHGPVAVQKLRKAAAEFEAQLLTSWWATMKQSAMSGSDQDSDPGKDTLDQLGMQAMSSAVANGRGGLGIGDMLVRSLLSNHPEIAGEAVPSVQHAATGTRPATAAAR